MSRAVGKDDDDFNSCGKATWSLKNKTYDPEVLRELEMEVIDQAELRGGNQAPPAGATSSSALPPLSSPTCLALSDVKENVEPSQPVAKKAKELEATGLCIVRRVPDRPLTKVPYMEKFSDELILMIFEWLPKSVLVCCARVCKRWRQLAYDETLWNYIDLGGKRIDTGLANHLLSLGLSVARFNSTEFESPVMTPMAGPLNHTLVTESRLTLLDLSYATITPSDLSDLLSSCHQLKKLSLESLTLSDSVCAAVARNPKLTTLNLCMCSGLTSAGLLAIFNGCPLLDELNVGWTDLKEGVTATCDGLPATLVKLCICGYRTHLGDSQVRSILTRCPQLVNLDVSDCILVSDKGLRTIVDELPSLEELFISRCLQLSPRGVREVKRLRRLKNLQAFSVILDDSLMRELRSHFPGSYINQTYFSTVARPTVGIRRSSIWAQRTR